MSAMLTFLYHHRGETLPLEIREPGRRTVPLDLRDGDSLTQPWAPCLEVLA